MNTTPFEITDRYALRFSLLMLGNLTGKGEGTGRELSTFIDHKEEQLVERVRFVGRAFIKSGKIARLETKGDKRGRKPKEISGLPSEFSVKEAKALGVPHSAILRRLSENKIVKAREVRPKSGRGKSMIIYKRMD